MKARALFVVIAVCLVVGAGALAAAPAPETPSAASLGPNLLANPSFETFDDYSAYVPPVGHPDCPTGTCDTAQMAPGWTPYWRSHESGDTYVNPEYKPADPMWTDPRRVRTGTAAQAYFTFYTTHEAGFYQRVDGVTPGESYCFSVWGHSWSADDDDNAYSGPLFGNFRQRVGIDPTGGADWRSEAIVWGATRVQYDYFEPFFVTATAQSDALTVYAYSHPEWPVKHNDAYWDDANLRQVEPVLRDGELILVASPDKPQTLTKTVNPNWLCDPETSWEVSLDPAGTLTPGLSASSGDTGTSLTVTLNSTGLTPGLYETALQFSSPDLTQLLPALPARIYVFEHQDYLPLVTGGQ
jgi:hypothetical protein